MAHVICVREGCPEYRVIKDAFDLPAEDIRCGACGDLVTEAPDDHGQEPGDVLPEPAAS